MKSSRFIASLIVLVAVQISALAVGFQFWKPAPSGRRMTVVEVAEADAARVFIRALVSTLERDPDYELRNRLLTRAKQQTVEVLRQSRASPKHILMTLAALDNLVATDIANSPDTNRLERPQRQKHAQQQPERGNSQRQPREIPELSAEDRLMRELDSQVVPRRLSDISRVLNQYNGRLKRGADPDNVF